jgi:glutathione S-transferase
MQVRSATVSGRHANARTALTAPTGRDIPKRRGSMTALETADVDTARNARGLRLVTVDGVPSPWSIAAKAIFEYKSIPGLIVRRRGRAEAITSWTGVVNAPIAVHDDEMPRSGWAEILALAERLKPEPSLVPRASDQRVAMFGLSHEILGAGGLAYNVRLMTIDAGFESNGERGFPLPFAQHLAQRYGHTPKCFASARAAAVERLQLLDDQLQRARSRGDRYFFGNEPTAVDFYLTAAMDMLAILPEDQSPTHPVARAAFSWVETELADAIKPALRAHRDFVHSTVWPLPLAL